jgi:thymidylate kinase
VVGGGDRRVRGRYEAPPRRHLLDALVTLDFVYGGVDLRLQRALVRRLLPAAAVTFHLDVPPGVAVARKPGDTFGDLAVRRQLDGYTSLLPREGVVVLDGTRPAADLAAEAFALLPRTVQR